MKKETTTTAAPLKLKLSLALSRNQRALFFRGNHKTSNLQNCITRCARLINTLYFVLLATFIVYAIFKDPLLLLLIPLLGGFIFYREYFNFVYWYLKVFVFKRKFYKHRRELFIMKSLHFHLESKRSKRYKLPNGIAIFWYSTQKALDKNTLYKLNQKNKTLTSKEYIKL